MEKFQMVAKTFQGLEGVLAGELGSLGAENVEQGLRMVSFEGDLALMYRANLCCRTALRILKPIRKFSASDADELYDRVRDVDWSLYLRPDQTFAIDTTLTGRNFTNSQYATYRVKDGIVDWFREHGDRRPSVSVGEADILFNVHISDDRITISLDSSGAPLYQRGYKVEQTPAPINEVLAAGILMLAGWEGQNDLADPMCGSGTFLIEGAMIAANINPGIYRKGFGFENWPDFDAELFESIYNDDSAEREPSCRILGGDIDATAVAAARANVRNARLEHLITVERRSIEEWTDNGEEGTLVMNPPYGRRLRPDGFDSLWKTIGKCLKENFKGWHAWIIGTNDENFDELGLKPTVKIPLYNGALECSLREFVMFAGRYNDFRAAGGSIGREDEEGHHEEEARPRQRHMDDREWKRETRRFGGDDRPKRDRRPFDRDRKPFERDRKPFDRDRKPFDRDRKPFERERKPFDRDRKPFDRDRKPFDRDRKPFDRDRKPFDRDRKPFDRDRKPFDRDRKPFDRDRKPFDRDRKPFERKQEGREVNDRGPRLDASTEVRFMEPGMRPRKPRFKNNGETPEESK